MESKKIGYNKSSKEFFVVNDYPRSPCPADTETHMYFDTAEYPITAEELNIISGMSEDQLNCSSAGNLGRTAPRGIAGPVVGVKCPYCNCALYASFGPYAGHPKMNNTAKSVFQKIETANTACT